MTKLATFRAWWSNEQILAHKSIDWQ